MQFYWTCRSCLFFLDYKSQFEDMPMNTFVPEDSFTLLAVHVHGFSILRGCCSLQRKALEAPSRVGTKPCSTKTIQARENENKHLGKAVLTCEETADDT